MGCKIDKNMDGGKRRVEHISLKSIQLFADEFLT
jgi:hypothetical protein